MMIRYVPMLMNNSMAFCAREKVALLVAKEADVLDRFIWSILMMQNMIMLSVCMHKSVHNSKKL